MALLLPGRKLFDPRRDLPGLRLWWDFTDLGSLRLRETSGVMTIARCLNKAGDNAFGWIEDFEPWEPFYVRDATYGFGHWGARTTSISDAWRQPNWSMAGFTEATGLWFVKRTGDPGSGGSLHDIRGDVVSNHFPFTDGVIYDGFCSTVRKTVGDPTPPLTNWHIYTCRSQTNLWKANLDGAELHSTTSNTFSAATATAPIQTAQENNLAHVMIFDRYLNAGQINALGRWLAPLAGIQWQDATS